MTETLAGCKSGWRLNNKFRIEIFVLFIGVTSQWERRSFEISSVIHSSWFHTRLYLNELQMLWLQKKIDADLWETGEYKRLGFN